MTERQFAPADYNAMKTAMKLVIADLGGIDAAASCTRVGRSQIADYGVSGKDTFAPADVVMDLERVGGTPHVTAALARAQGYMLVPIDMPRERGVLASLMAEIGRDVGELFATAATALAHDKLTDQERQDLLRELDTLRRVSSEAFAFLMCVPA
ncbi:hypothetical protein [Acidocella sp.]|uniref:hypothetical protein n=1 Tax=Acidocella sp. TaxID=50710 RepID=UPI002D7E59B4|nr:hypothetical protein [Acidocella sp.]